MGPYTDRGIRTPTSTPGPQHNRRPCRRSTSRGSAPAKDFGRRRDRRSPECPARAGAVRQHWNDADADFIREILDMVGDKWSSADHRHPRRRGGPLLGPRRRDPRHLPAACSPSPSSTSSAAASSTAGRSPGSPAAGRILTRPTSVARCCPPCRAGRLVRRAPGRDTRPSAGLRRRRAEVVSRSRRRRERRASADRHRTRVHGRPAVIRPTQALGGRVVRGPAASAPSQRPRTRTRSRSSSDRAARSCNFSSLSLPLSG